jgi:hypothetical protein
LREAAEALAFHVDGMREDRRRLSRSERMVRIGLSGKALSLLQFRCCRLKAGACEFKSRWTSAYCQRSTP